jgi:hypothetical protein
MLSLPQSVKDRLHVMVTAAVTTQVQVVVQAAATEPGWGITTEVTGMDLGTGTTSQTISDI